MPSAARASEIKDPVTGQKSIIGVGRIVKLRNTNDAEFALIVSDAYHKKGLGSELLRRLIQVARDEKLSTLKGAIMPDNPDMQRLCERLGFELSYSDEEKLVMADLNL